MKLIEAVVTASPQVSVTLDGSSAGGIFKEAFQQLGRDVDMIRGAVDEAKAISIAVAPNGQIPYASPAAPSRTTISSVDFNRRGSDRHDSARVEGPLVASRCVGGLGT